MAIWCLGSVSEVLRSVFYQHYIESVNCSIFDEEKGRHALSARIWGKGRCTLSMCVSHLKQREMRVMGRVFLLVNCTKRIFNRIFSTGCSFRPRPRASGHMCAHMCQRPRITNGRRTMWSSKLLEIFKLLVCRRFKSWLAWCIVYEVGLNFEAMRGQEVEGRGMLSRHVSHLRNKEMRSKYMCLTSEAKGDVCFLGCLPFS
jgi:hypothetical protein